MKQSICETVDDQKSSNNETRTNNQQPTNPKRLSRSKQWPVFNNKCPNISSIPYPLPIWLLILQTSKDLQCSWRSSKRWDMRLWLSLASPEMEEAGSAPNHSSHWNFCFRKKNGWRSWRFVKVDIEQKKLQNMESKQCGYGICFTRW